jgi:hypothetical protein
MFNIFTARRTAAVQIARDADDLLARMRKLVSVRQRVLDALGDRQCDIDLDLVNKIEELLSPMFGPSGTDDEASWFQNIDWYGDGIRHLEFRSGAFQESCIPPLQKLLEGDCASFGILCWAPQSSPGGKGSDGVVIFNDTLVLTKALAGAWGHA